MPGPLPTPSADPPRPLLITRGAQPLPSGQMTWLRSVRETPAAQPDRRSPLLIAVAQPPLVPGQMVWLRAIHVPNTDPPRPIVARVGQQPTPAGQMVWLRSVRATPAVQPDRRAVLLLHVGQQPRPVGQWLIVGRLLRAIVHAPYNRNTFVIGAETLDGAAAGLRVFVIGADDVSEAA